MIVRDLIRRFGKDARGNVAIISAFLIVVLVGAAGGGVDLSLLVSKHSAAQDAADAAALFAASANTADIPTLQKQTTDAFNANVKGTNAGEAQITSFNYDAPTQTITVKAGGTYTPLFAQLFGTGQVQYGVTSTTRRAVDGTVEVALVLDNTYSMSESLDGTQSKITVLKTAAKNLVGTLMTPNNAGYVKIGVVPYADYVNVGLGNRNQSWLTNTADYSTPWTSTKTTGGCTTPQTCTGGVKGTCTSTTYPDGVKTTSTYSCWIVPQTCVNLAPVCTPVVTTPTSGVDTYKWLGCVKNQVASGKLILPDPLTPYVGIIEKNLTKSQKCLNPILPLASDASTVNTTIDGLVIQFPGGGYPQTYIPGGLVWGTNVLSPPAPFTEGAAYDPKNKLPRKAMILMTDGANYDGLNSDGTLTGPGTGAQLTQTYVDQARVCDYAKSKGIEVYTIGFGVSDPNSLSALQSCATDASHYFDAQSSAALLAAFQTIAGSLSKVRIAH